MAKVHNVNTQPVTGAEAIFTLKATLKAAGWTVPCSSDGSTYNAAGDQISHAGSGANGMANSHAWFVIREPGGLREWCFQKGSASHLVWRVKVSACDLFIGGAPDATHTPTATDQLFCIGGGTDASPTYATTFIGDATYRYHVIADNAPIGTGAPAYSFYAFSTQNGTGNIHHFCFQEPMLPGSYPELSSGTRSAPVVGDPDPVIYACGYSGTSNELASPSASVQWQSNTTNMSKGWYKMNYVGEASTTFEVALLSGDYDTLISLGTNPYNGGDDTMFCHMSRPSDYGTYIGNKGIFNKIKYAMANRGAPGYPNTINLASADAYVYMYLFLIPWPTGVTPL